MNGEENTLENNILETNPFPHSVQHPYASIASSILYTFTIRTDTETQGGAQVGLQLFIWKIMQYLINNTRINCVWHTRSCKHTWAPPCI